MSLTDPGTEGVSSGAKIAFVAALIFVAFLVFVLGKNLITGGLDSLEDSVRKVDNAQFSEYNNQSVRGSRVKSALQNFANKEYAILVGNLTYADGKGSKYATDDTYKAANQGTIEISGGGSVSTMVGTSEVPAYFINYNATIGEGNQGDTTGSSFGELLVKDPSTGNYIYSGDFKLTSAGDVKYFLQTMNIKRKGNDHYIADQSIYESSLITNPSGEIMGIVFLQKEIH